MEESNRYSNKFKNKEKVEEKTVKNIKQYKKPKYKNYINQEDYV